MRFTQITFRHMAHSPSIGERIRKLSDDIEQRYPKIERCRAFVEEFRTPAGALHMKVTVDVRVAGVELSASAHGPDIEKVLQSAFEQIEARLVSGPPQPRAA